MSIPSIPSHICNFSQLNDALRRIRSGMRETDPRNKGVTFGLDGDFTLSASTLTSAAVLWSDVLPRSAGGNDSLPDWLYSGGNSTDIVFKQTGFYQLSWMIEWTAGGSGQDHAKSFPSVYKFSTGEWTDSAHPTFAAEDAGVADALIYPARPIYFEPDDALQIVVARVSGASSAGWTAKATSFLSVIQL